MLCSTSQPLLHINKQQHSMALTIARGCCHTSMREVEDLGGWDVSPPNSPPTIWSERDLPPGKQSLQYLQGECLRGWEFALHQPLWGWGHSPMGRESWWPLFLRWKRWPLEWCPTLRSGDRRPCQVLRQVIQILVWRTEWKWIWMSELQRIQTREIPFHVTPGCVLEHRHTHLAQNRQKRPASNICSVQTEEAWGVLIRKSVDIPVGEGLMLMLTPTLARWPTGGLPSVIIPSQAVPSQGRSPRVQ